MEEIVMQINGGIMINVDVSVKNVMYKDYVWNPATCNNCENRKYLANIMDYSTTMCDDIIESQVEEANFNEKKAACKTQNFYILLAFLLISIALLIAVSIYCYLIKYQAKQKHYHLTSQITN